MPAWSALGDYAPLPAAHVWPAAGVIGGKLYFAGGVDPMTAGPMTTLRQYDPVTDAWTTLAPMPTARMRPSGAVVNDKLYVIGGRTNATFNSPGIYTGAVEVYDPATGLWTTGLTPGKSGSHRMAAVVGGLIYLFGAGSSTSSPNPANPASTSRYNPATDVWTELVSAPANNAGAAGGAVGTKVYVIGGGGIASQNVLIYDTVANTWTTGAPFGDAINEHVGTVWTEAGTDYIYITGGRLYSPPFFGFAGYNGNTHGYDPAANAWTYNIAAMPITFHEMGAGLIGVNWHVAGGRSGANATLWHTVLEGVAPPPAVVDSALQVIEW